MTPEEVREAKRESARKVAPIFAQILRRLELEEKARERQDGAA